MSEPSATAINPGSFEKDSAQYYDMLFRLVLRHTSDPGEAEDLAQTAFTRFLRLMKRKQWKVEIADIQAYLARIAINLCKDGWKRKEREKAVSYDDDHTREEMDRQTAQADDSVLSIENRIYAKELYRSLPIKVILAGLDEYEKQIFLLRRVDELSIKEVADTVQREICQVRYDLQKIEARIRYRSRKVIERGEIR